MSDNTDYTVTLDSNETSNDKLTSIDDTKDKKVSTFVLVSSISIGMFMGALDESIINVSLPTMTADLNTDQIRIQWIILAYLLVIVGLTALAGHLGDRFSTKLVFQIGMVIFSIGSLFCALSRTLWVLVIARIVQAIGASGTLATGNAIVTRFTDEKKRGLSIGLIALVSAMGVVIGPAIGGFMTDALGWQSIFWINVPIGVLGFIYVQFGVPKTPSLEKSQRGDPLGSILFAVFMTVFILGIALFADPVLPNPKMWSAICLGISVILLIGFILWERKAKNPFIALRLFKNRKFTIGVICSIVTFIALNSVAFQLPFYLQDILNYETLQLGLVIIGVPVGLAIAAPISGKIASKVDSRILSTIGLSIILVALILIVFLINLSLQLWAFVLIAFFIGLGIGTFTSPNTNSIMSSIPKDEMGVVSGLNQLARNIGYSIGVALSTTIFYFILEIFHERNTGTTLEDPINYVPALRIMFGFLCIFLAIAVTLSALRGPEAFIQNNKNKGIEAVPGEEEEEELEVETSIPDSLQASGAE